MANREHIRKLRLGIGAWNSWRLETKVEPDLSYAKLSGADLRRANLSKTDFSHAELRKADFTHADLSFASFDKADLRSAKLMMADLTFARLRKARLGRANFLQANLNSADLSGADCTKTILFRAEIINAVLAKANLNGADLGWTVFQDCYLNGAGFSRAVLFRSVFADCDMSGAIGLDTCVHEGPSTIDHRTLQQSGQLPLSFLRGVGLPDPLIDYLPSFLGSAIQFFSCFISYSSVDQKFVERLHADLQNQSVRCWFAPHDLPIGGRIWDEIDSAIRLREKVLLILSE
ncbi:MAG: toll/interleukin-1 receptor domain-containing protein, partial [Xanthobacteraceae bacterium]